MPLPEQTFVQLDKTPIEGQLDTQLIQLAPNLDIGSRDNSETRPVLDLPINGAETSSLSGGQGMDYVRRDGTVEHAASREEALRLCPVLGQMALRDPEAANLFLDLAEMGRTKMDEEAHQKMSTKLAPDHESNTVKPEAPKVEMSEKSPVATSSVVVPEQYSKIDLLKTREPSSDRVLGKLGDVLQSSVNLDHRAEEVRRILDQLAENPIVEPEPMAEVAAVTKINTSAESLGGSDMYILSADAVEEKQPIVVGLSKTAKSQTTSVEKSTHPDLVVHRHIGASQTIDSEQQARLGYKIIQQPERTIKKDEELSLPVDETGKGVRRQSVTLQRVESVERTEPADISEPISHELQIYENFNEALAQVTELAKLVSVDQFDEPTESDAPAEALRDQIKPVPAVAQVLVQRMSELEASSQAELAPQVTSVMEAVQHINQSYSVSPEAVQAARDKLAGAVAELFEQLNIDYEAADVEQFIAVILRPDFANLTLPDVNFAEFDLEKDGTHEAKKRLVSAAADLIDGAGYSLERLIGVIMLIGLTAGRVAKAA